jgi:hypothetical protein
MKNPIFILGAHKSGTSLLRSLFDGVEGFFSVPLETHFFQHLNWWIEYPFRKTIPQNQTPDMFMSNIKKWIRLNNTAVDYQSDGVKQGFFNVDWFDEYVMQNMKKNLSLAENFTVYIEAIYYSMYGNKLDTLNTTVVEKSVENAEFALDLKSIFPDATFVHIVRNPYANLVSIRKYISHRGYPFLLKPFRSLNNSYYFLHRNRRLLKDYHVVRYEDLVSQPFDTVTSLCNLLGKEFQQAMLVPTQKGDLWLGNSTDPKMKFTDISTTRINSWQKEINPLEISFINRYIYHIVQEFGYERKESKQSPFFPVRDEGLEKFVANRFYFLTGSYL